MGVFRVLTFKQGLHENPKEIYKNFRQIYLADIITRLLPNRKRDFSSWTTAVPF